MVADLMSNHALDDDCTVIWAKAVQKLTGRELKEVKFTAISDISKIKDRTPVFYKRFPSDKGGHWVGVENGKIAFNPLTFSICASEGKPYEIRELIF